MLYHGGNDFILAGKDLVFARPELVRMDKFMSHGGCQPFGAGTDAVIGAIGNNARSEKKTRRCRAGVLQLPVIAVEQNALFVRRFQQGAAQGRFLHQAEACQHRFLLVVCGAFVDVLQVRAIAANAF